MYLQHFGLTQAPLGKKSSALWDDGQISGLATQFKWLLHSPGIGILTAEPGIGKTAALRQITRDLNPHRYQVHYMAETDFGRLEFYRQLALSFGLVPAYKRLQLWRDIKDHVTDLVEQKQVLPVIIIDEAQNLPPAFMRDLPSFLNFAFDSQDRITVWLVGHPELTRLIDRHCYAALASRIQARYELHPIMDREAFKRLLAHGFEEAGCKHTMLSDPSIELVRMASQGNPRQAHIVIITALRIAADKKMSHLSDDVVKEAITLLKKG
jgi:MSHA biogenesis protein MshM